MKRGGSDAVEHEYDQTIYSPRQWRFRLASGHNQNTVDEYSKMAGLVNKGRTFTYPQLFVFLLSEDRKR